MLMAVDKMDPCFFPRFAYQDEGRFLSTAKHATYPQPVFFLPPVRPRSVGRLVDWFVLVETRASFLSTDFS